jgi:hypothetical protein
MKRLLLLILCIGLSSFAMQKDGDQTPAAESAPLCCSICSGVIENGEEPPFCCDLFIDGDSSHAFHPRCIIERIESGNRTCPVCEKPLRSCVRIITRRSVFVPLSVGLLTDLILGEMLSDIHHGNSHDKDEGHDSSALPNCHMQKIKRGLYFLKASFFSEKNEKNFTSYFYRICFCNGG